MMLSMEYHSSCRYDYVEVRDGDSINSRVIGRFCGNNRPAPVQSSGNSLHILFVSDGYKNFDGFFATFQESSGRSNKQYCLTTTETLLLLLFVILTVFTSLFGEIMNFLPHIPIFILILTSIWQKGSMMIRCLEVLFMSRFSYIHSMTHSVNLNKVTLFNITFIVLNRQKQVNVSTQLSKTYNKSLLFFWYFK